MEWTCVLMDALANEFEVEMSNGKRIDISNKVKHLVMWMICGKHEAIATTTRQQALPKTGA